jgi:hypothetical protein
MTAIGWRLDWFVSTFFGTKRKLSKYSANSLHSSDYISNKKIKNPVSFQKNETGLTFEFQSIDSVIKEVTILQK